jgi:lysozyme
MTDRAPIFEAFRAFMGGRLTQTETDALDDFLDRFDPGVIDLPAVREVGPKGIALMHRWEGCELKAYPDPGSANGKPWTIGWGSTGPGIGPGTVWTQEQADARFEQDLEKYAAEVSKAIGNAPTTQEQFDALVAFHYNTGKIGSATLTKKHVAGDYAGAAREFDKWVFNDGKKMKGLVNRRADEAKLYRGEA